MTGVQTVNNVNWLHDCVIIHYRTQLHLGVNVAARLLMSYESWVASVYVMTKVSPDATAAAAAATGCDLVVCK